MRSRQSWNGAKRPDHRCDDDHIPDVKIHAQADLDGVPFDRATGSRRADKQHRAERREMPTAADPHLSAFAPEHDHLSARSSRLWRRSSRTLHRKQGQSTPLTALLKTSLALLPSATSHRNIYATPCGQFRRRVFVVRGKRRDPTVRVITRHARSYARPSATLPQQVSAAWLKPLNSSQA